MFETADPAPVPTVIIAMMPIIAATVVVVVTRRIVTAPIVRMAEPDIEDGRAENH